MGYSSKVISKIINFDPKDILIIADLQVHTHQMPKLHYILEKLLKGAEQRGIKISFNAKTTEMSIRTFSALCAGPAYARVIPYLLAFFDSLPCCFYSRMIYHC